MPNGVESPRLIDGRLLVMSVPCRQVALGFDETRRLTHRLILRELQINALLSVPHEHVLRPIGSLSAA